MMALISWSGLRKPWVQTLFFHQEPGLAVPQCGQRASSTLINFLQFGQRMDRLGWLAMDYPIYGCSI
jgi:hypothetical protein